MSKRKSAERKLKEFLMSRNSVRSCDHCSYYRNGYCNDLDVKVDKNYPVCSEENYRS